ncbi:hypothetical protein KAR48_08860 [bacterium]|nr:hypothetical protein [bacterium]
MQSSKQEQFAWASMLATIISMIYYSIQASILLPGHMIPLAWTFIQIIIWMILTHSLGAVLLMRPFKKGDFEKDERDTYIQSKANRISFIILFASVNLLLISLLFCVKPMIKTINIAHALFFMTFGAHAISQFMQVIYYRRGG